MTPPIQPPDIAPDDRPPWEYFSREVGQPMDDAELNRLGRDGWSLRAVLKYGGLLVYHFARRIRSPLP
jgi:hypothetical protein